MFKDSSLSASVLWVGMADPWKGETQGLPFPESISGWWLAVEGCGQPSSSSACVPRAATAQVHVCPGLPGWKGPRQLWAVAPALPVCPQEHLFLEKQALAAQ